MNYEYYQAENGLIYAVDKNGKVFDVQKDKSLKPSKSAVDPMWGGIDESDLDALLNQFPYVVKE